MIKRSVSSMVGGVPLLTIGGCGAQSGSDGRRSDHRTTRELEVIRLITLGLKNKDIVNRLSISDITVRHHLTSIFCKLEVADRQQLLILAHRYGLADLTLRAESA
jgi:DNA-binding NarL/FixJ family response regulator